MQRKLVKQGTSTLFVSLPSKWIKERNLKKGDEVEVEDVEGSIVIGGHVAPRAQSIELELTTDVETSIRTIIINAYRSGYDSITLRFPSEKCFAHIANAIDKYLMGFDIVERHHNSCRIANISEPASEQGVTIFNKIFTNISYVISETNERLRGKSAFPDYASIIFKTYQYDNFCRRLISKNMAPIETHDNELVWNFLGIMIHGLHEFLYLNMYLDKHPMKVEHPVLDIVKDIFALLHKAYTTGKIARIEELHALQQRLIYDEFYDAMKTPKGLIPLYHYAVAGRTFYFSSSPLIGLIMRRNKP